jgi:uncharacterized membrane protein (UPF0182 family)
MSTLNPAQRKRFFRITLPLAIILVTLTVGSALMRLQADAWWYALDAQASVVFYTPLKTRALLFVIGVTTALPILYFAFKRANGANIVIDGDPVYLEIMPAFRAVHSTINRLLKPITLIIAIFFGLGFAALWERWLLQYHAVPFGRTDPIFGLDYAYFVFELSWRQGLVGWLLLLGIVVLIGTAAIYNAVPMMAQVVRLPVHIPHVQKHLTLLAGAVLALGAAALWYSRYDAGTLINDRFTGASYSDLQALGAKTVLAVALLVGAAWVFMRRSYTSLYQAAGVSAVIYVFGVIACPAAIQNYKVAPNELSLQTPYIKSALDATRYAYALDKIENVDFNVQLQPTAAAIKDASTTLGNMRLWDPDILRETVDNLQSLRDYYGFQDIDVDRYEVAGRQRLIMLGARDLLSDKLDESRKNWQNLRLQYTHGNGVAAVPVDSAEESGQPEFVLSDIPPRGAPELAIEQPRIYYSDSIDEDGTPMDRYVFVRSTLPEFDYSVAGDKEYRWEGDGGIPISGLWRRLVYAYTFGDKDLLFTDAFTDETRLLFRRNIRERARHIFPYLNFDNDPYIAIVEGRLVWILDGYTNTDRIPYSAMAQVGSTRLNYIRNSVKMTIDAYDGSWNAYAMDAQDPILRVYSKVYPGLLKAKDEAPPAVVDHFRYPEDLFLLQAFHLTLYHRLDENPESEPAKFFRFEDAWQVPDQAQSSGGTGPMSPYYVQMRLPNERRDGFMLILPFNPRQRPNMIGWLAAHCDSEDYGRLQLFRFPRDKNINGPAQQEARFQTNLQLSEQITLIGQVGSEVRHGNLLVVPIGQSVMYVKTLFLVSRQTGIRPLPELKLVVLAYSNKIVFAETYERALQLLTSGQTPQSGTAPPIESNVEGTLDRESAERALRLMEAGRRALAESDWEAYGKSQRELETLLKEMAKVPAEESGQ